MTISSPITRFARFLNSSSVKTSLINSGSGGSRFKSIGSNGTGESITIVANIFERSPCSLKAMMFSFILPFKSSVCSNNASIEPYSPINFFAVFSPIPGIPGMLSAASPHKPRMSITCNGCSTSNFSQTSLIPKIEGPSPPLPGL